MSSSHNFLLPTLTSRQKSKLLNYAQQVLTSQQEMTTKKGKSILHYTLQKKRKHILMNHYPKGDRIDHQTGAQYFYHCHRENYNTEEHGHFHCFLRYKHIPKRYKPRALPDWDKYIDNPMTHLVAISMNRYGQPIRLFTVNRWITSEIWYNAQDMPQFVNRFKMTLTNEPYWSILDQWVEGILHLFSPQIAWLHLQRDQSISKHQLLQIEHNVFEDKELEELSSISIDLNKQVAWLLE